MNKLAKLLFAAALTTGATSCDSFLDVNVNPNQATVVTPDQLLGNALTVTGANYTNFNSYTNFMVGYFTKSNAVSGFNEERNYNYSSTYQQGLFNGTYDNLNDYNLIQTLGVTSHPNHAAIARIMKVYNFLLLVDEYGDIPYTDALKGKANITPKYDKAEDIYKDFIVQLKGAVSDINAASTALKPGPEDVVFGGGATGMAQWKRFANSLRLRILLRQSNVAALNGYVATEMGVLQTDAAANGGYITSDVNAQPGFAASAGQQNPFYNFYGFPVGSPNTTPTYRFILPTTYLVNLFVNNSDPRITQEYRPVGATKDANGNQTSVGKYVGSNLGEAVIPSPTTGSTFQAALLNSPTGTFAGTFIRSPNQPVPLMLLAEHLFSKAEAESRSLLTGDAKADFLAGIRASFNTTFRNSPSPTPANRLVNGGDIDPASNYDKYIAANVGNGLVDWDAATTPNTDTYGTVTSGTRAVSKLEKILTQKYLAENTFAGTEAWDDFRRTLLPKVPVSIQASVTGQFAKRLLYPQSEINTNKANVPLTTTQYDRIFWVQL
ncbi:SusD/RagB family nutrient-binding outer membrane lipoprotein [Hymenobacter sp. UYCo722]|uniref:SusD/RagB family nutrient-binding outer membrane lipoprotein n=1 Tax=Hymenobacter sp. UYCo722 TaxID=3156335 RepID=UPI0033957DD4